MLTPKLENAILKGWATYKVVNHAFGGFGAIPIPKDSIVIITDIKWYPFLNPFSDLLELNWVDFFRYNEYQLKIDGKKSLNYLVFRNEFNWKFLKPIDINLYDPIDYAVLKNFFLPEQPKPIHQDVFFVCQEYIKLTITRNSFIYSIDTDFAPVSPKAAENDIPDGIKGIPMLLRAELQEFNGVIENYYPPTVPLSGLNLPNDRNIEGYKQDFDKPYSFLSDIKLNPPGDTPIVVQNFPYSTTPLVQIGMVVINSNDFDKLQNS
jgi:hypothetical protein